MDKPDLFVYWENAPGKTKPEYIKMCYETMEKNSGCNIKYITRANLFQYVPNLRKDIFRIESIAIRCDYIRLKLIQKHGGIYLDSDCIVLKSFAPLYEQLMNSQQTFLGIIEDKSRAIFNGFMCCKPQANIINKTVAVIDGILDANPNQTNFPWMQFGSSTLRKFNSNLCTFVPLNQIIPMDWWQYADANSRQNINKFVNHETYCFMLHNAQFGRLRRQELNMTRDQIMKTDMVIGQAFRKAFNV